MTVASMDDSEPVMNRSRHHASGANSARGLLFTVLGEFVLPSSGSAWTSAFINVLGRVGIEEKACRQALMRTAGDGWLKSERIGRRTCWHLTPNGERLLTEGTERIYGFGGAAPNWDGRWLLVLARVPESERPSRHQLRTRLSWAGLGSPAPGVWVGTHVDRLGDVEGTLRDAGIFDDAQVFVAEHRGSTQLTAMVAQAWDLTSIDASYREFIADFRAPSGVDPLVRTIHLVHAWRRFPWVDPGLPIELLPTVWSGIEAAKLFRRQHARWAVAAMAEWRRISVSST